MGLRQHRQNRHVNTFTGSGDRVYARNDQLAITSRQIGTALAKQQARMNRNALLVDTRNFYYFRRRSSGRLCSCILGDESTPNSTCLICYNTGFVGGYDKYGTCTEVVDTTHPTLVMNGVHCNYEDASRPVYFKLDDDAKLGTVQATIQLRKTSNSYVDVLNCVSDVITLEGAGVVDVMCREYGSNTWLQFNTSNVETILRTPSADAMDVIIYMKRKSLKTSSPLVSHVYLRYGLIPASRAVIHADIPRNTESISLQEYGFEEQFGTLSMFLDNTIQTYSIDDFFYYIDKNKFWKLTEVQPFYSMGMHVSFDATARHLQPFEIATKIPV